VSAPEVVLPPELPAAALAAYALGGYAALKGLVCAGGVPEGEYACPGEHYPAAHTGNCETCQGAATVWVRWGAQGPWMHGGWL
jgi:hypothetical protein